MALGQGGRLLESINEPIAKNPDHNMNQDEMENLATVQRSEQQRRLESLLSLIPRTESVAEAEATGGTDLLWVRISVSGDLSGLLVTDSLSNVYFYFFPFIRNELQKDMI